MTFSWGLGSEDINEYRGLKSEELEYNYLVELKRYEIGMTLSRWFKDWAREKPLYPVVLSALNCLLLNSSLLLGTPT